MKQVELAVAIGDGYTHSMVSMIECGHRTLRYGALVRAAQALDVSLDWLAGLADDPTPPARLAPALIDTRQDAALVPLRDVRAAGGWAAEVESESAIGHVAFPRRWMRRQGLQPERCSVIEVVGESMEPLLVDGCWILVDHARSVLLDGRVFAVWIGDGLVVKRAARSSGDWLLASENASFAPLPLPRESRVVGQVKWAMRSV